MAKQAAIEAAKAAAAELAAAEEAVEATVDELCTLEVRYVLLGWKGVLLLFVMERGEA